MNRPSKLIGPAALALALAVPALAQEDQPKTAWIGSPLSVEFRLKDDGKVWAEAGLAGLLIDPPGYYTNNGNGGGDGGYDQPAKTRETSQTWVDPNRKYKIGWMVGLNLYKDPGGQGLALGLRAGSADSVFYVQPTVLWVVRAPDQKTSYRVGVGFPIGKHDGKEAVPLNLEFGVGFQF